MLPQQLLSTVPIFGEYLSPDGDRITPLLDYELGGIGLQDPTHGMRYQTWKLEYVSGHVFISAPNTRRTILFSRTGITDISLAFDQNMNPFVGFTEGAHSRFYWYDTTVEQMIFTDLPSGSICPRCCLDDKRETQTALSDIIIAYIRADGLYFRAQRDRFLVEYTLQTGLNAKLDRIGMTTQNRIQFKLIPNVG